jgi:hypothetical protein
LVFKVFSTPILLYDILGILFPTIWIIARDFTQAERENAAAFLALTVNGLTLLIYQDHKNRRELFLQK